MTYIHRQVHFNAVRKSLRIGLLLLVSIRLLPLEFVSTWCCAKMRVANLRAADGTPFIEKVHQHLEEPFYIDDNCFFFQ